MRIALICLDEEKSKNSRPRAYGKNTPSTAGINTDFSEERLCRQNALDAAQTLALARHMRDGGHLAPVLVCRKGSAVDLNAQETGLPEIALENSFGDWFRLWRWQRKYDKLHILAIGEGSLPFAGRLLKMRGKRNTMLATAFFLKPPRLSGRFGKTFLQAAHCICGSSFVAERIEEWLDANSRKKNCPLPQIVISPPGIELDKYNLSSPLYVGDTNKHGGKHFVFGMAESLMPRSGALLVVRAMSALWQKDELPPWEVRMFGSGPRFREILDEAEALGVQSRLSILSDQPLGEVSRMCHAWLAPGVSPEEMPQDLWTGLAAALPTICVNSPLHDERLQLTNNHAVLCVGKNNPQETAGAMIDIMLDRQLRESLVSAARSVRHLTGVAAMAERVCMLLESWLPIEKNHIGKMIALPEKTESTPGEAN